MKLQSSEQIADGTFAFRFERPAEFEFVPGQFIELALEDLAPSDPFRSFSIASAPNESHIMIATRLRDSAFKQALRSVAPGFDVQIEGPYGRFILSEGEGLPHVLIGGGIGITPFRSMIVEATDGGMREPILLFHVNRDEAGAPFAAEMTRLSGKSDFLYIPSLTRPSEDWSGETGYIDGAMLSRYVDVTHAKFYVSGPPPMVQSSIEMLGLAGVAKERIFSERFEGY